MEENQGWWQSLMGKITIQGNIKNENFSEETTRISENYSISLPISYLQFMNFIGPGSFGKFLHFLRPGHLNTHKERLLPFWDEQLSNFINESGSGDVLIFAFTNNGDMFGWHLSSLHSNTEPEVIHIPYRSFDCFSCAKNFKEFLLEITDSPNCNKYGLIDLLYIKS